eukprot:15442919-Alexandrium_andersonii.AAC.1
MGRARPRLQGGGATRRPASAAPSLTLASGPRCAWRSSASPSVAGGGALRLARRRRPFGPAGRALRSRTLPRLQAQGPP